MNDVGRLRYMENPCRTRRGRGGGGGVIGCILFFFRGVCVNKQNKATHTTHIHDGRPISFVGLVPHWHLDLSVSHYQSRGLCFHTKRMVSCTHIYVPADR